MPKTTFVDGNPALGIEGTLVTAEWLNGISNHRHDGKDLDGHGVLDYAVSAGSPGAYEITLNPPLAEYIPGMPVYVKAHQASIGGDTLKIDSLDALPIGRAGQSLAAGEIVAGQMCIFIYDDSTGVPSFHLSSASKSWHNFIATSEQARGMSDDTTIITPKKLGDVMNTHVLGVGQTWQDMSASRVPGVTYTNTTGRAIAICIRRNLNFTEAHGRHTTVITINGRVEYIKTIYTNITGGSTPIDRGIIVPPDATYKCEFNGFCSTLNSYTWEELR